MRKAVNYTAVTVGCNKAGNIVLRKGFFYTNGASAESFTTGIMARLNAAGLRAEVIASREIWKPFRGGSTLANQSHWYLELKG